MTMKGLTRRNGGGVEVTDAIFQQYSNEGNAPISSKPVFNVGGALKAVK